MAVVPQPPSWRIGNCHRLSDRYERAGCQLHLRLDHAGPDYTTQVIFVCDDSHIYSGTTNIAAIINLFSAHSKRNRSRPDRTTWSYARLVLRGSLPIDEIGEAPRVLAEVDLQLALIVENELCRGEKHARALRLVLIVELQLTAAEVKGLALGIRECLAKPDQTVGDEDDLAPRGSGLHADVAQQEEHHLAVVEVTGSRPVIRSQGALGQLAEPPRLDRG